MCRPLLLSCCQRACPGSLLWRLCHRPLDVWLGILPPQLQHPVPILLRVSLPLPLHLIPLPVPVCFPVTVPPPGVLRLQGLRHRAGPPHVPPPPRRVRPMSHPSPAACPATHDSALQVSIQLPDLDFTLLTARSFQADLLCAKAGILLNSW